MNREKSEISVALKYCKEKLEGRVGRGKGVVKELDHQAQALGKHAKKQLEVTNRLEIKIKDQEKNKTRLLETVDSMQKRYLILCRMEELASEQVDILEQANKSDAHELSQLDSKVRIMRNASSRRRQEARQAIESAFNAQLEAYFNRMCVRKKQKEVDEVLERTDRSMQELMKIESKIREENEHLRKEIGKEALIHEQQIALDLLAQEKTSELKNADREMKYCARESNELNVALLDLVDKIETESARGQHLARQLRMFHPDGIHMIVHSSAQCKCQSQDLARSEGDNLIPFEQLLSEIDTILCGCIQEEIDAKQDFETDVKRTQDVILETKQETLTLDQSIEDINDEIKILESQKRQCQRDLDILKSEHIVRANAGNPNNSVSLKAAAKRLSNLQLEYQTLKKEIHKVNIMLEGAIEERDRLLEEHSRNSSQMCKRMENKQQQLTKHHSMSASLQKSKNTQSKEMSSARQVCQARAHLKSIKRHIADTIESI